MVPEFFLRHDRLKTTASSSLDLNKPFDTDYVQLSNILGYAIWYDVFSNLFAGTQQSNSRRYIAMLEADVPEIQFSCITRCQNWVVVCLLKVLELQTWKRGVQVMQRHSAWDIMEKAMTIRQSLEIGITTASLRLSHPNKHPNPIRGFNSSSNSEHDVTLVTYVYACTTAIILEVIVSGAHPDLSAIQKHVAAIVMVLSAVQNSRLLDSLCSALCISGCMVDSSRRHIFEHLLSTMQSSSSYQLNDATEVIHECWRLRDLDVAGQGVDWADAMKSLGKEMLLI